ncbi:hypothetical protein IKA15_01050 [bacterium]|nr:hypothetical protein [bacterium]
MTVPINSITTSGADGLEKLKKLETAEEVKETKTAEAKELENAKTNENSQVAVEIAETEQPQEKKGFFAKLGDAFKSLFTSDNTAGKAAGGFFGSGSGVAIGSLIGNLIFPGLGGIIGGVLGGLIGGFGGAMVGDNIQEKMEQNGQVQEDATQEAEEAQGDKSKAGTVEETIDEQGNRIITEYDENGNVAKESKDINNDGTIETVKTYEYNDQGQMTKKSVDYLGDEDGKADGKPEYTEEYEYDDAGNLTKTTNKDENGETTSVQTSTYDANGNQVTRLFDRDADGVKNGADEYYEYSYNDQGQMTEIKYDGSDGKWNTTYEYDENGNKVKELIDYDLDGVPDEEKEIKPEE